MAMTAQENYLHELTKVGRRYLKSYADYQRNCLNIVLFEQLEKDGKAFKELLSKYSYSYLLEYAEYDIYTLYIYDVDEKEVLKIWKQ